MQTPRSAFLAPLLLLLLVVCRGNSLKGRSLIKGNPLSRGSPLYRKTPSCHLEGAGVWARSVTASSWIGLRDS